MLSFFKSKKKESEQDSKIKMFINAGIEYFRKRDYGSSRKYFERVLEIDPSNAEAQQYLDSVKAKIEHEENKKIRDRQLLEESREQESSMQKLRKSPPAETTSSKPEHVIGETRDKMYYYKILRLELNAAPDDIREAIALEFKKWRTRVNSPDITKRYEAEEMLNIISQAKRVLLDN